MNMREFENLSLRPGSRQASQHGQGPTTLPGFDTINAVAGQGEVPTVLRPQQYSGTQTPHLVYYRQPPLPQQASGQFYQVPVAAHRSHAHPSIEASTPPTAFNSPRTTFNDHTYDSSSVSSSSRESSAHPRGSISSTTAQPRSTRTKRGSESQGSGSDRSNKRPSTRSRTNGDNGELWCAECECRTADCSDPKRHAQKLKKIVKEKSSRSAQAALLQNCEDLTQIALNVNVNKKQMPGNKKKSGLTVDKKQGLMITEIALDEGLQTILACLGQEEFQAYVERVHRRFGDSVTSESTSELPKGSLMAGASGEEPCPHVLAQMKCDSPIECRKEGRFGHFKTNKHQIIASRAGTTFYRSTADSQSQSSTPRRH